MLRSYLRKIKTGAAVRIMPVIAMARTAVSVPIWVASQPTWKVPMVVWAWRSDLF